MTESAHSSAMDAAAAGQGEPGLSDKPARMPPAEWLAVFGDERDRQAETLAEALESGSAGDAFPPAFARLTRLAEGGSAWAAWLLGRRLTRDSLTRECDAAAPLLSQACDAGIEEACRLLDRIESALAREGETASFDAPLSDGRARRRQ
ncbi:MAG: hypothetical protein Q4F72_05940 [Desulfovibrionaceae bacterium]|nr:hypothetical protein [Desulfovibrionaceae bacterium]